MRPRGRPTLLALIAATLTALAVGPTQGGFALPPTAQAFGGEMPPRPASSFPLPVTPEYGDGLGAGRGHEGVDLFAPVGTPELAVSAGIVIEAGSDAGGGRGNFVSYFDPAVNRTYSYFHMLGAPFVQTGDRVRAGQRLGELGCSGSCWGDHLHFEVRQGRGAWGPVLDPVPVLHRLAQQQQQPGG